MRKEPSRNPESGSLTLKKVSKKLKNPPRPEIEKLSPSSSVRKTSGFQVKVGRLFNTKKERGEGNRGNEKTNSFL